MTDFKIDLTGRVAVVTGASRRINIGTAICRLLAAHGADVIFTHWRPYDRQSPWGADEEWPELLEAEMRNVGVRAHGLEVDLSQPQSPGTVLDTAEDRFGPVSILVNNAAHSERDGFEKLTAAGLDAHYAVNMRTTMLLSTEFAKRFRGEQGGRIVNLSSGQSLGAMPTELAYIATKGAVETLSRVLAAELGAVGVRLLLAQVAEGGHAQIADGLRADDMVAAPSTAANQRRAQWLRHRCSPGPPGIGPNADAPPS